MARRGRLQDAHDSAIPRRTLTAVNSIPTPTASAPGFPQRPPVTLGALGNGLLILALAALAAGLAMWQVDTWTFPAWRTSTLLGSAAVIAGYAGFVRLLRGPHRRPAVSAASATASTGDASEAHWLVVHASQFGQAESLAARTALSLRQAGQAAQLISIADLDLATLRAAGQVLFVASTTGEGDAPDPAFNFIRTAMEPGTARLDQLRYGVLALGDSDYQHFCAFGHQIDQWLRGAGAQPLFDVVEVDDGDPGALRHWQYLLGRFCGAADQVDWEPPAYARWLLDERRHLNAGSPGAPVFDLRLSPESPGDLRWQAGDVAEIGPQNPADHVRDWLSASGLDGSVPVTAGPRNVQRRLPLAELLASSRLPSTADVHGKGAQQVADELLPLPHRAYSIASIPAEGCLRLLVRQTRDERGALGLGSGWLTTYAEAPGAIHLRIRRNANFHAPNDACPLILIGNGTGLAGLRALLQERIKAGRHNNWLLFGERSSAHDLHYRDDIKAWHRAGQIERLDVAFSRDAASPRYVQHLLAERAELLRNWLQQGASVYVCGSLKGMAPAVEDTLASISGGPLWHAINAEGRYRRDVY
ncbi:sulfite reductase flavoprotein subunit alpha [Lysobacter ciconiae]|uniref:NADPH--hemoprotein reductase n=2 Tax=Novilysobacter ciconiae TaxID=2781022 RepID=A0A7S6UH80_9GAMM|nr:sulfite reductase flavoprotein subunit alpha [Lysobacter ciconiae]